MPHLLRYVVFAFLASLSLTAVGQSDFGYDKKRVSRKVKKIVQAFDNANRVEGQLLGVAAIRSKIYPAFKQLAHTATRAELIELTKHHNPITRTYAFNALAEQNVHLDTMLAIVELHLCDTQKVTSQAGCRVHTATVGDRFLTTVKYGNDYPISEEDEKRLDSLLFWNDRNLIDERNYAIAFAAHTPQNYKRLRQILINEQNPEALLALLKYNMPEDANFIPPFFDSNPGTAVKAVGMRPLNQFVPLLKSLPADTAILWRPRHFSWSDYYQTVMQYPDSITIELLSFSLATTTNKQSKELHAHHVFNVLSDSLSQAYLPLKFKALRYLNNVSLEEFEELWQTDSVKTLDWITYRFRTESHPFWKVDLLNCMIDKVEIVYGDSAIDFINRGIKNGYSISYYTLAHRAKKYHNAETVAILSNRFNEEVRMNEQSLRYRVEGLLQYDNKLVYRAVKEKAFVILHQSDIGNFAGPNLIKLALKCDSARCVDVLLQFIEEEPNRSDFLSHAAKTLLSLENAAINAQLVAIYQASSKHYKRTYWGKYFRRLLENGELLVE